MANETRVLRPKQSWFLARSIPLAIFAVLVFLRAPGATVIGLMAAFGAAILWLLSKTSSVVLDGDGFAYRTLGKRAVAHRWVDIERFAVVRQRALGLITINRFVGWNYTPAFKHYKRLAIPRAVARWVGMTDALVNPIGFDAVELVNILNSRLHGEREAVTRAKLSAIPMPQRPPVLVSRRARQLRVDWTTARSWFGGAPRLGEVAWPRDRKSGKPLPFLAQIDLAEVAEQTGNTVPPGIGSLAFFAGKPPVVYLAPPQSRVPFSTVPPDAPSLDDAGYGGSGTCLWPDDPAAPRSFPFWPVEFMALPPLPKVNENASVDDEDEEFEARLSEQVALIKTRYLRRPYNFSAKEAFATMPQGTPQPWWWHSAMHFSKYLHVAATSARRPGVAVELASAFDLFVAEVEAWTAARNPWAFMDPGETEMLASHHKRATTEFRDLTRYCAPSSLTELSTHTLLSLATAHDEAYATLPESIRALINGKFLLPVGDWHQMFGEPIDIQGGAADEATHKLLLLRLNADDMVNWRFGDCGAYNFFLAPEDLTTQNWAAATMTFECH